jgi:hypothetical protein
MSNVNIYFGAQPSAGQIVSDEVKAKGLELLRIEPSKVNFHGGPTTVQPRYAVYKAFLPMFIRLAHDMDVTDFTDPFGPFPKPYTALDISFPDLVVSWSVPVADEVRAQLREIGFMDTIIRGKPAMKIRNPGTDHVKAALERRCLTTSATNENSVNIHALRRCALVRNIASLFLAVHQYPAFVDEDHESEFNKEFEDVYREDKPATGIEEFLRFGHLIGLFSPAEMEVDNEDDQTEKEEVKLTRRFRVSLSVPVHRARVSYDDTQLPIGPGLLFPYVEELAKFDRSTVVDVIKRYFYAGLGDTAERCDEEFRELVAAWGNIANSSFGNKMAHIFKIIDISLTMQACPKVCITGGSYDGILMLGAGYRLVIQDKAYVAAERASVEAEVPKMVSHARSLYQVLQDVNISQELRDERFKAMRSIKDLKTLLESQQIVGGIGIRDRILRNARFLNFPGDRYWEPTAVNICAALSFITNPLQDLALLPTIHPSRLFSSDRLEIVWSAFGAIAPSFRVPGGKEMMLTRPFRIATPTARKERGVQGTRDITKIAAILVPLDMAIVHLRTCIESKSVLNPFGNAIVNASTSHINKIFERDSCDMLVRSLRDVAKVTVVDEGARGTRRGREEDDEAAGASKKGRIEYDF